MRFFVWFLSSAILVVTVCVNPITLEAAENSQTLESISKIESFLDERQAGSFYLDSKFPDKTAAENSQTLESISKIESFLDERQAGSFYLNSNFPAKTAAENDRLHRDMGAFKDELLKDASLTKEGRLGISRQLIPALINSGKNKEALEVCKDFSDRYPENKDDIIRLYYLAGSSFQKFDRYDEAIESYRQALLYSGKGGFTNYIRINLGWCYYKKSEYDKAIDEYTRTLQEEFLDPGTIQWAWFEIGRCHFFLKNYEDAVEAFRQVLSVNPDTKLAQQAKTNIEDIERLRKGGTS